MFQVLIPSGLRVVNVRTRVNTFSAMFLLVKLLVTNGGQRFPSNISCTIKSVAVEFHASCSAPIVEGNKFGSIKLVGSVGEIEAPLFPCVALATFLFPF